MSSHHGLLEEGWGGGGRFVQQNNLLRVEIKVQETRGEGPD